MRSLSYSDLIIQEGEYNYSANIQYDIENDRKLYRFIPNETTVSLLREYFTDITRTTPEHHARILYGSYGTGKSHFLTVLTMLLGKLHVDGVACRTFLDRISEYDPQLSHDIENFVTSESRKPFLIVPIVFDFDDFERCIYFSLKKKLESIGVSISFKTFFDQANSLIQQWKSGDESKEKLLNACKNAGITIEKLEKKISSYDDDSEAVFQKVFAEMTYGVKFIYEVSNLSDIINQANFYISDNYSGIVFIFDEFGRYIEDNIKKIRVKSVQDLAEFCDHCDGNNHIILVSHKEISQYTQRFGKSVSAEWKKVEGRYKATPINDKQDQCLSLIRNILTKDARVWKKFQQTHKKELNNMYSEGIDFKGFLIDVSKDNPFEGGFPLHPISLFALDKLSKKVAQNERTFFTYLASKEENSLYSFLIKHELEDFHFVGIDNIYDYFEPSIKAVQSDESYVWYKNLQSAISKIGANSFDSSPEVKLLKVIATIGIINDSSTLISNKETLHNVIDCPNEILDNALTSLSERRIIKYSGSYDRYEFFEASIFDVEKMIEERSKQIQEEVIANTLNEEFVNFALYPHEYNRTYKISRVFIPVFANASTSLSKKSLTSKLGQHYDGALIMYLSNNDETDSELCEKSKNVERSIFFINKESEYLKDAVKHYVAVKYLESQKLEYVEKDPSFEKELLYFKKEISDSIFALIYQWIQNYTSETRVMINGDAVTDVNSFDELCSKASDLCATIFNNTLIVNNELLNKNSISGSISAAKKNVIANLLRGSSAQEYYETSFLSPEYICVRSLLAKNGFINNLDVGNENVLPDGTRPQEIVQKLLSKYISKSKTEPVNFAEVINELKAPPYGLRTGYLSLLLAHCLFPHKKSLIINSHDVEQELSVEVFEEIVRRPDDFSFAIASWTKEQVDFLDALEQIFKEYIREGSLSKNRLKAIYEAMLSHYKNVSKFARTTQTYVNSDTSIYRKILEKNTTNYSAFFFKKLKELGDGFEDILVCIKNVKAELENATSALANELAKEICTSFDASVSISLSDLIIQKYKASWEAKRKKSFDYYTNAFLDFANKITFEDSDYEIVLKLSKVLTGFELIYWNDSHKDEFISHLIEIKNKLDSYGATDTLAEQEAKISLTTSKGVEKTLVFDKSELGVLSQTVKNKINATFSNYGMAITYDEKVQIVLSLLEDLMEGK